MTERTYLDDLIAGRTIISGGNLPGPTDVGRVHVGSGMNVSVLGDIATITASAELIDAAPKWRTAHNIDFTNQSPFWPNTSNTKIFTADGQYFLDDLQTALYFANFNNLYFDGNNRSRWAIQNGSGLEVRPNAAGTTMQARTAPRLYMRLATRALAPMRARISYVTSYGSTVNLCLALAWANSTTFHSCEVWGRSNDAESGWSAVYAVRQTTDGVRVTPAGWDEYDQQWYDTLGIYMPAGARPLAPGYLQIGNLQSGAMLLGDQGTDALHEIRRIPGEDVVDFPDTDARSGYCYLVICPEFLTHSLSAGVVISRLLVEQFY